MNKSSKTERNVMMNAEIVIEKLRDSIENYEVFKELALDIRFRKADLRYYSWSQNVLGIDVRLFRFADSINEDNIVETIVQCRLMRMADKEEWKEDFWDVSSDSRLITLNSPVFMHEDLIIRGIRLTPLDTEECLDSVICQMNEFSPVEDLFSLVEDTSADIKDTICDIIRKSQLIELSYDGLVRMRLSVSEDTVLIIEHGIWD